MGHTEINAWGNHVRHQLFSGYAVIVEPRISILLDIENVSTLWSNRYGITIAIANEFGFHFFSLLVQIATGSHSSYFVVYNILIFY